MKMRKKHSTWSVILIICGVPLCSSSALLDLSFLGLNKANTNTATPTRSNSSMKITSRINSNPFKFPVNNTAKPPLQLVTPTAGPIQTSETPTSTTTKTNPPQPLPDMSQTLQRVTNILKSIISSTPDEAQSLTTVTQPTAEELLVMKDFQKNDSEWADYDETDDEYPDHNECVNNTVIYGSGQEIDETRKCPTNTSVTTTEATLEIDESDPEQDDSSEDQKKTFHYPMELIPPVSDVPSIKFAPPQKLLQETFSLKTKTVTLTNYIIKPSTVYQTEYASCLLLENVQPVCKGRLITIEPTHTIQSHSTMYQQDSNSKRRQNYELRHSSDTQKYEVHDPAASGRMHQKYEFLEPSELDNEVEIIFPDIESNTSSEPILDWKTTNELSDGWINTDSKGIIGLKIERIDKILPSVTTATYFNKDLTATVIAKNCLPLGLNIPFCSPVFIQQTNYEYDVASEVFYECNN